MYMPSDSHHEVWPDCMGTEKVRTVAHFSQKYHLSMKERRNHFEEDRNHFISNKTCTVKVQPISNETSIIHALLDSNLPLSLLNTCSLNAATYHRRTQIIGGRLLTTPTS
jgi:hypothetical protein